MFDVAAFLDRAKTGAGVDSDYALAKLLGHKTQSRVSNWRRGENAPDTASMLKLCEWSGDDPDHVAACLQSMRAANDDEAAVWERIAARLKAGANVIVAAVATLIFLAPFNDAGDALACSADSFDCASVYYVKCIAAVVVARIVWRVARLFVRTGYPGYANPLSSRPTAPPELPASKAEQ